MLNFCDVACVDEGMICRKALPADTENVDLEILACACAPCG